MPPDWGPVLDMLKAARLARAFVGDLDHEGFLTDAKTQSAVLHQLLVLGEAAKRVSGDISEDNPNVPWRHAAKTRDRLIHGYHDVDVEEVWMTVQRDLPRLIDQLERIVPEPEEG